MNNPEQHEPSLEAEFRSLGRNFVEAMTTAWDRPERKKLQQEIEDGLSELTHTLRTEASSFMQSPSGQKVKTEFEEARQKFHEGEAESVIRQNLFTALRVMNQELEKIISQMGKPGAPSPAQESPAPPAKETPPQV